MIATGFQRSTDASAGRESQSIAFFRTPEVPRLYSGVAMSSASASRDGRFSCHGLGIADRFDVVVVERDLPRSKISSRTPAERARGGPQEGSVVRALPQAAGDPEDSGHWRIAVMSAVISTRVGPHSRLPWTRRSVFSTPSASTPVPWNFASSSTGRDVLDRQLADELVAVALDVLDAARLEADLGEALDVEQVGRAEVLVALLVVGQDACRADDALCGLIVAALDATLEVGEAAADRFQRRVGVDDVEPDARVDRVDRPGSLRDEGARSRSELRSWWTPSDRVWYCC